VDKVAMYQFDDLDEAVVGLATQATGEPLLVYDYVKIVEIFMRDGMTEEEAQEYADYNVVGLNLGDRTPLIMTPCNMNGAYRLLGYDIPPESDDETNH